MCGLVAVSARVSASGWLPLSPFTSVIEQLTSPGQTRPTGRRRPTSRSSNTTHSDYHHHSLLFPPRTTPGRPNFSHSQLGHSDDDGGGQWQQHVLLGADDSDPGECITVVSLLGALLWPHLDQNSSFSLCLPDRVDPWEALAGRARRKVPPRYHEAGSCAYPCQCQGQGQGQGRRVRIGVDVDVDDDVVVAPTADVEATTADSMDCPSRAKPLAQRRSADTQGNGQRSSIVDRRSSIVDRRMRSLARSHPSFLSLAPSLPLVKPN